MSGTVVLCIGNPFRHDDGVASAVAERVRRSLSSHVPIVELDGEPARVVDAWTGSDLAIVIDAARSDVPPGSIRRIEVGANELVVAARPASSHGYALGDAVELGRALGRLPARLVVFAVEGLDFSEGPGLTGAVARAVPDVVDRVVGEVGAVADEHARESGVL
jgi:hydrogenase maturation protease